MQTNLALNNILHNLSKTAVALSGIGVAIVLIFMQLGFRGAVESTATTIYDSMEFDLIVRSPNYLHFVEPGTVSKSVLREIAGMSDVKKVIPFHVTLAGWRHPLGDNLRGVMVMGIDPKNPPFDDPEIVVDFDRLTGSDTILMDIKTHREFGPINGVSFSEADIGRESELSRRRVRIAGLFKLGSGLTANGAVITTEEGFSRLGAGESNDVVSFGLIQLEKGVVAREFIGSLNQRWQSGMESPEVEFLDRREVSRRELRRWIGETPIGFVFTLGVLISFIVGASIFYMVLATDVANRLTEYATLKAMGYSDFKLSLFVLQQASYLSLFAFAPSLLAAWICYGITASLANIPIMMTLDRVLFVFLLTQLMCIFSGTLAMRKLYRAEPAALF
jgi:putative ABC transport system permease protein